MCPQTFHIPKLFYIDTCGSPYTCAQMFRLHELRAWHVSPELRWDNTCAQVASTHVAEKPRTAWSSWAQKSRSERTARYIYTLR